MRPFLAGPTGLGTSACRIRPSLGAAAPVGPGSFTIPELRCPPPVRIDTALAEEVDERLLAWAEQVGIYPGCLDRLRAADFGLMAMLGYPDTDDPERLLAPAKCAATIWAVDDFYCDDADLGAVPELLGSRLAIAAALVEEIRLPLRYAPALEQTARGDPLLVALRGAVEHMGRFATPTQLARSCHALFSVFLSFGQEGSWRLTGRIPPVWEYLQNRQANSYLPFLSCVDTVTGYEVAAEIYADSYVRSAVQAAALASTLVNDLYSIPLEDRTAGQDFNLPIVIAAEENCSLQEAVDRTAAIHDELMLRYEAEAAALSVTGPPELRRYLTGVMAWMAGAREWHRRSPRYRDSG
ncbi:family 2 encapsulin nanocompartment cargo protein terpene cyclase [Streptomyces sp. BR1]|uniref:family 2 encapsulin nanocompartment cargo protein terpene cyclase n=1 Tax=Streptomyces sp. BR1 TaxID=1592323 RepID=UPI00402BEA30